MGWLDRWFPGEGHGIDELARRLHVDPEQLRRTAPRYREFSIAKRRGGRRRILAPQTDLKNLQRRILRCILARLKSHPAAMGFERGRSIVTNALPHQGQAVVLRLDVKNFFASTRAGRVRRYFRLIGWNRPAAALLTRLCTHEGGLPQGAPTSPRLSNLVNYPLDARLSAMCERLGAVYTRYADDITISLSDEKEDRPLRNPPPRRGNVSPPPLSSEPNRLRYLRHFVRRVFDQAGYTLHWRKKASIRRRNHRQLVCGLVVNHRANLPRETRRWLRAVEHRTLLEKQAKTAPLSSLDRGRRKSPTLTQTQLDGWRALRLMITQQMEEG
ncbi:MAG: RNA-directed DNA polymerase [Pirellulales bacterium]|nr:RNA-directed DNA polymerase [Pirellulales bacterium]